MSVPTGQLGPEPSSPDDDETAAAGESLEAPPESPLRVFVRRFARRKVGIAAAVVIALFVLVAVFAPWLAPYGPLEQDVRNAFEPPSTDHLFGTDELGRDVLSRLIYGARISLQAAVLAVAVALALGLLPGVLAGYARGWVDTIVSRVTDTFMSFPPLLLAIAIVGVFGPGLTNAMFAIGIIFAPRFVRISRASVLVVREETFIEASRSIGSSRTFIVTRRVLPNILSPLLVQITLSLGLAMLAEASLSFLGLGVQPPEASWGAMVGRSFRYLSQSPYLVVFPGAAIAFVVLAFNLLGDNVRDSLGSNRRAAA